MKAPAFWYRPRGFLSHLLAPLALGFRLGGVVRRAFASPYRAKIPVICVGNIVAGGAGKTPTALAIAELLKQKGAKPVFVTRGYGGREAGPLQVDSARHTARDVGDEALLLARTAPVWIGRNRAAAIRAAEPHATHIILDDGLQNPTIKPDISLLVIDGETGLGNGCIIPAGPLRESLDDVLKRVSAVVVVGNPSLGVIPAKAGIQYPRDSAEKSCSRTLADWIPAFAGMTPLSIIHADLQPDLPAEFPKDQKFFAFAGIGRPEKFYKTCHEAGLKIIGTKDFPDHHIFAASELTELQKNAAAQNARLLTTEKDWVRLPANFQAQVTALPVRLVFENPEELSWLI